MATVVLSTQGQLYENATLLSDAPALVLAATDITVFNRSGGVIESTLVATPAIRIDGLGGQIVNQAGATIRGAGGNAAALAIVGSDGDDLVDNSGTLIGALSLGLGGDTFTARVVSEGAVDLGGGNDSFLLTFSGANRAAVWTPTVSGGAGLDFVSVAGIETARGANLTGFEILDVGATVTNLQDFSGYQTVALAANGSNAFVRSNNPLADLQLNGNQLTLGTGTVFRNIIGGVGGELVEFTGNGATGGRATGTVLLADGNDIFRLTATGTGALPTGFGVVDGGAGADTLGISLRSGATVDLSVFANFEVFDAGNYAPAASSFRIINANNFLEIFTDASGTLSIGQSNFGLLSPGALGTVTIEATTTIGRIGLSGPNAQPDNRANADTSLNLNITNNGTVTGVSGSSLGAVNLFYGNDFYDGRLGVQNGTIAGYAGSDTIYGGAGAETLDGGFGADSLFGGGGDDLLIGGSGNDLLDGGAGNDRVSYASALAGVRVNLGAGTATGDGADTLVSVEGAVGSAFADVLAGSAGVANMFTGGAGDDIYLVDDAGDVVLEAAGGGFDQVYASSSFALQAGVEVELVSANGREGTAALRLTGNGFAQELYGNNGNNVLDGRGGADTMFGFGGDDVFVFTSALGDGVDTIGDFSRAQGDRIYLAAGAFTGIGASATGEVLNAGAFALSTAAPEADDRIIYNAQTGALFFDADGSGAGAAVQFATLAGAPQDVSAAAFIVG